MSSLSVLEVDIFALEDRITDKSILVKIGFVYIHSRNLVIFVSVVIINTFAGIAAGGIKGDLVFSFCYLTAASLLIYRSQNMEKLADAFRFRITGKGIHFGKSHTYKT